MRTLTLALFATLAFPSLLLAQTLEKIASSGELNIGFRSDAAPLSFLADNAPQGYAVDVCLALAPKIAAAAGLEDMDVVFEPVTPENRFEKVVDRDIDLLCGAATITLERRKSVDFSEPVYVDGSTLAIRRGGPSTFDALTGRKIGVRSSTTTFEALTNSLQAQGVEAEVVQFDDHPSGMAALKGEIIDAYFADQSILMNMVMNQADPRVYQVLDEILTVEKQGLALPRGDADFRLAVDRALSELFADGTMRQIFEKNIPGAKSGLALEAMYLLSPTLP